MNRRKEKNHYKPRRKVGRDRRRYFYNLRRLYKKIEELIVQTANISLEEKYRITAKRQLKHLLELDFGTSMSKVVAAAAVKQIWIRKEFQSSSVKF